MCRMHGGAAPQVRAAAKRRLEEQAARRAVAVLGLAEDEEITPDPHTALLAEVYRAARWVAGCEFMIAGLTRDELVYGETKRIETDSEDGGRVEYEATLNVWLRLYHGERDRLVRASKAAVDAGVSERAVRLEEEKARLFVDLLGKVFDAPELGLTEEQRQTARELAAGELRAIGGSGL